MDYNSKAVLVSRGRQVEYKPKDGPNDRPKETRLEELRRKRRYAEERYEREKMRYMQDRASLMAAEAQESIKEALAAFFSRPSDAGMQDITELCLRYIDEYHTKE